MATLYPVDLLLPPPLQVQGTFAAAAVHAVQAVDGQLVLLTARLHRGLQSLDVLAQLLCARGRPFLRVPSVPVAVFVEFLRGACVRLRVRACVGVGEHPPSRVGTVDYGGELLQS